MSKITFDVNDKDLNSVLTILNSLKQGMIQNIQVDNKKHLVKKANKAVLEDEFMTTSSSHSKYMSRSAYRSKLNTKVK